MRTAIRTAVVVLVSIGACKSTTAVPAKKCADPCCGGRTSIDCAQEPNVSCLEDADPCIARAYGCVNGRYYLTPPEQPPPGCDEAGADTGGLILGDGNLFGPDAVQGDEPEAGTLVDATDDAATETTAGD